MVIVKPSSLTRYICLIVILGIAGIMFSACSNAQPGISNHEISKLGSVQVGKNTISIVIAYYSDSALVMASLPGPAHSHRYIPLIDTTYHGVSSFGINILSTNLNDKIWILMSKPEKKLLAYYKFDYPTAITPFGRMKLLDTPFPDHISGGPIPFPSPDSQHARLLASFYHYGE